MSVDAFGKPIGSVAPTWGLVKVSDAFASALEPAPVTPTTGSGPYELLSGTVLSTLKTNLRTDDFPESSIVSPGLSLGRVALKYLISVDC
jgi:Gly-Xaa carboxypeptidase